MPFVSGFLRVRQRPGGEGPTDPEEEGETDIDATHPIHPIEPPVILPKPPPGVWPPISSINPLEPAAPGTPPGAIWPTPGTAEHPIPSKVYWVIAGIPGMGWCYVSVDPSLKPSQVAPPSPPPTPSPVAPPNPPPAPPTPQPRG